MEESKKEVSRRRLFISLLDKNMSMNAHFTFLFPVLAQLLIPEYASGKLLLDLHRLALRNHDQEYSIDILTDLDIKHDIYVLYFDAPKFTCDSSIVRKPLNVFFC